MKKTFQKTLVYASIAALTVATGIASASSLQLTPAHSANSLGAGQQQGNLDLGASIAAPPAVATGVAPTHSANSLGAGQQQGNLETAAGAS